MTLYEINDAIKNFEFEIDEETGEVKNLSELDSLEMSRTDKIDNLLCLIKNIDATVNAIKEEEKKLATRRKAEEKKSERLRDYVKFILGGEKFESARNNVTYRKSKAVNIIDESILLLKYFSIKKSVNKTAISDDIKSGIEVKGAEMVENISMILK